LGAIGLLPRVLVGAAPQAAAFDPAFHTVYVANQGAANQGAANQGGNTLSMINARTCNARRTAGCGRVAPTSPAGDGPFFIGISSATHTLYVSDQFSNTVTVINAATCNAMSAATSQPAASEVGHGAWTSAVYWGCQGRRRGHQPGTARRYSSYRAPNRPCSSGCSNP
jgi:DNA-binding beta-propeller fold protein YncE